MPPAPRKKQEDAGSGPGPETGSGPGGENKPPKPKPKAKPKAKPKVNFPIPDENTAVISDKITAALTPSSRESESTTSKYVSTPAGAYTCPHFSST